MDARIDPYTLFGLEVGSAHVIRNAGAVVTPDVLRSLAVSQRMMGTRDIAIVAHTDCGLRKVPDEDFRRSLQDELGIDPPWRVRVLGDPDDDVRLAVRMVCDSPFLKDTRTVAGYVLEVESGIIREVELVDLEAGDQPAPVEGLRREPREPEAPGGPAA